MRLVKDSLTESRGHAIEVSSRLFAVAALERFETGSVCGELRNLVLFFQQRLEQLLTRAGSEGVVAPSPRAAITNELHLLEDGEVGRGSALTEVQDLGEVTHRELAEPEEVQDPQPGLVAQGLQESGCGTQCHRRIQIL